MFFSVDLQKETAGALTHSGAHLDLSAFSSADVSSAVVYYLSVFVGL